MNRQEFLLLTTTAVGAAIFGFLVGDRGPASTPPLAQLQAEPISLEPLLEELRKLTGQTSGLAQPAQVRETTPRTAINQNENATGLVELLERCDAVIQRMEQRGSASTARTAPLFRDSPTAAVENLMEFQKSDEGEQAFNKEHQLLSFQQVLDRYGSPTEIWNQDSGVTWMYRIEQPGGNQDEWSFSFAGGFVYRCDAY